MSKPPTIRCVVQRVNAATLQKYNKEDGTNSSVSISKPGLVVYVSFLKDCTQPIIDKVVESIVKSKYFPEVPGGPGKNTALNSKDDGLNCIQWGAYGGVQALKFESDGPYTSLMEF